MRDAHRAVLSEALGESNFTSEAAIARALAYDRYINTPSGIATNDDYWATAEFPSHPP